MSILFVTFAKHLMNIYKSSKFLLYAMNRKSLLALCLTLAPLVCHAQKDLAPTPPMGWMSWNLYGENINEQVVRDIADAMVANGYRDAGYKYIYIDDCWQGGRDNRNNMIPDPKKFPGGMKALADYVHAKGLKLGIYSDASPLTCAGYTASYGFEEQDARTFAAWGIDYLKYDYCNAPEDVETAKSRYGTMAKALRASGRDIVFGVCEWGQRRPSEWVREIGGQVFRSSGDVRDKWINKEDVVCEGIMDIVEVTAPYTQNTGRGCWNDMDMLVVGLYGKGGPAGGCGGTGCTDTEYRSQMSLWSMMASPLNMSHDLTTENPTAREILQNREIIAIDQDALGIPAVRKVRTDDWQIFIRPLSGGRYAVALLNTSDRPMKTSVRFADLGITGRWRLRDVWAHRDITRKAVDRWSGVVQSHETRMLVLHQGS